MSDLPTVRTRVRVLLQDEGALNHSDNELDEAIRQALREYNDRAPALVAGVATLAAKGWEVDLSELTGIQKVYAARWPWDELLAEGDQADNQVLAFTLQVIGGAPKLRLSTMAGTVPAAGDGVWVVYGAPHTLDLLDGGTSTSAQLSLDLLALGAAGLASVSEGSDRGELLKPKDLREAGVFWLREFRAGLERIEASRANWPVQQAETGAGASLPAAGWSVDPWDVGGGW